MDSDDDDASLMAALAASKVKGSEDEGGSKENESIENTSDGIREESTVSPGDSTAAASACAFVQLVKYIGSWEHAFAESSLVSASKSLVQTPTGNELHNTSADRSDGDASGSELMRSLQALLQQCLAMKHCSRKVEFRAILTRRSY